MPVITYAKAEEDAWFEEMQRDPKVLYLGVGGTMQRLATEFGPERVRATPVSEEAAAGMGIGLAAVGFRPVVDFKLWTFAFMAMEQFVNQAAKLRFMFGEQASVPVVFRALIGGRGAMAAQHSIVPYSMFMNIPGLKIVVPATPYDMKGLTKSAIRDGNPVMVFVHSRLGTIQEEVPDGEFTVPFGQAAVRRQGKDVTIVAISRMVHEALAAAQELAVQGVSAEVIDPRTLVPLDVEAIRRSVQKTGRLVVADEATRTASAAAEIAAIATEDSRTFPCLKAPVQRVCAPDTPAPYSPTVEAALLPGKEQILAAVKRVLG